MGSMVRRGHDMGEARSGHSPPTKPPAMPAGCSSGGDAPLRFTGAHSLYRKVSLRYRV